MTIRLYHPNLEPPHNECEVMDEAQAAVYAESGWKRAPEPEAREGYAPEPVEYAPVEAKPAKAVAKKTTKSTDD